MCDLRTINFEVADKILNFDFKMRQTRNGVPCSQTTLVTRALLFHGFLQDYGILLDSLQDPVKIQKQTRLFDSWGLEGWAALWNYWSVKLDVLKIDVLFVEMLLPGAEARRQTKAAPGKTVQGAYLSQIIRRPKADSANLLLRQFFPQNCMKMIKKSVNANVLSKLISTIIASSGL